MLLPLLSIPALEARDTSPGGWGQDSNLSQSWSLHCRTVWLPKSLTALDLYLQICKDEPCDLLAAAG